MNFQRWEPRKLGAAASAHLDLIRGVAALAVMWGHLRTLFFVDFGHLQNPGWLLKIIYFSTGFGHQAVMVFFVLSGFLISSTVIKSHFSGTWSWRDYAINRSTRLYVVLIPGLLLGLVWDFIGSQIFASSGVYSHPLSALGPAIPTDNLTVGSFFGNLFFVQTILCPSFGSNGPLWSLANEFWYYALFPLSLSAGLAWARRSIRSAVPLTALVLLFVFFLGRDKLIGFLIWIAGCALVLAYARFRVGAKSWLLLYIVASSVALWRCLTAARASLSSLFASDLAVGLAFALFLFGILQLEIGARSPNYVGMSRRLARFSYSLYVLHFPFLLFLRSWIVPAERWQPSLTKMLYATLVGFGVLSFAWLVSLCTEDKTRQVRDLVQRISTQWSTRPPRSDSI